MKNEEPGMGRTKSEVVHARLSQELKEQVDLYAQANSLTLSSAISKLVNMALEERSALDEVSTDITNITKRLDSMEKSCALASKRAGKASQASLGILAFITWLAPDAMRFLANEALLRGQLLSKVLDNDAAAANVKVPSSLGRLANTLSSPDLFKMLYSEVGGKLSRDPRTTLMPALASAIHMFDLETIGLLGMDAEEWHQIVSSDTDSIERLADREMREIRHG